MQNTYKTMQTLRTSKFDNMSLEELAGCYNEELNPSILATAFCHTYALSLQVAGKFFGLCSADIASYALESLDQCLQTFDADKYSKFSTYYYTIFKNRLRTETQSLSTQKRKAIFHSDSLTSLVENGFDIADEAAGFMQIIPIVMQTLGTFNLSANELKYCKLVMIGYTNSDIAKLLGVSTMTISNIRKRLRIKLQPMCV